MSNSIERFNRYLDNDAPDWVLGLMIVGIAACVYGILFLISAPIWLFPAVGLSMVLAGWFLKTFYLKVPASKTEEAE